MSDGEEGSMDAAADRLISDVFAQQVPTVGNTPQQGTPNSAGSDLIYDGSELVLKPGRRILASTGTKVALPKGTFGMVCPRSGLAVKHGVTVLNGPGIIDCDYRGEIKVPLINLGDEDFVIVPGMRVAQLVVTQYVSCVYNIVEELDDTVRGSGGFGSTGE